MPARLHTGKGHSRQHKGGSVLVSVVLGLSLLVLASSPVLADAWGTNTSSTGAHPDGNPHTYCRSISTTHSIYPWISEVEENALGNPTDANVVRVPDGSGGDACDFASSTETDVVWRLRDLSGTTRGSTFCEDFDTHCDQFYADIDYNYIVQSSDPDESNVRKTICHELGHTVGLTHGSSYGGCMVSGPVSGDIQWRRYAPHHKEHIDAWFS